MSSVDIDFFIEDEGSRCRALLDTSNIVVIKLSGICSYSGGSGGEAWEIELSSPMPVFSDYKRYSFFVNDENLKKILLTMAGTL
jgi:hypothetical protein